ncbi:fungal trichothecene efflux pump [Exophiala viscosa]|uniref:Fungal trichothecene efflux pump n=3 Tax=Exophiala viscosa TaxID=2486360 RepID=A0AAN6E0B6_9EURO|nr:fungal trichothecene efflux pump [Exophiala viscosa]
MTTLHVAAASTVLGFGCGIIFVGYAGIPELLPNKWRGIGLGWTEFCITMPWAVVAVLLGNALAEHASWRWCYYISIIYSVICLVGTACFYFPPHRPQLDYDKSRWHEVKEIDYIGLFLYATGLTVFLVGLNWAGTAGHGWKSVSVIAPIVLGFLAFVACFVYDFTLAKRPFFPFELFKQVREFTILLVLVFVSGMIFYSMAGLLPQGSLYMFTNNSTEIGLLALPNGFSQLIGGWVIPSLAHKIKHLKWQLTTLLCFQTLFVALYAAVIPTNKAAWSAFQFFGQGCFAAITLISYIVAGLHIPQRQLGIATGLIGTFRSAGGSVGITVFDTILSSTVNSRLGPQISEAALAMGFPAKNLALLIPATIENASGVPNAFAAVPGISPAIELAVAQAFKDAYAYAFRRVFLITIPFGVVAIIATLFIRDPSRYLTNHVAVHMEKEGITGAVRRVEASTMAHTLGDEIGTSTALEGGPRQDAIGLTGVHSTV